MVDRETIKNVARFAHLANSEVEVAILQNQLSVILENIVQLQEINVTIVSPSGHVSCLSNIMYDDTPKPLYACEVLPKNDLSQEDN